MAHKISPVTFTQEPWHGQKRYIEMIIENRPKETAEEIIERLKS
jgi:hypothetical protein